MVQFMSEKKRLNTDGSGDEVRFKHMLTEGASPHHNPKSPVPEKMDINKILQNLNKSDEECKFLYESIKELTFFQKFSENHLERLEDDAFIALCKKMKSEKVQAGDFVFRQDDPSNKKLYVVLKGKLAVIIRNDRNVYAIDYKRQMDKKLEEIMENQREKIEKIMQEKEKIEKTLQEKVKSKVGALTTSEGQRDFKHQRSMKGKKKSNKMIGAAKFHRRSKERR